MRRFSSAKLAGSSPLTRGKLSVYRVRAARVGLIPAHAGKTRSRYSALSETAAHPRSRGENTIRPLGGGRLQGSSPLTRGKPPHLTPGSVLAGLIPAHAGKTRRTAARSWRRPAHPRSRGENPWWIADKSCAKGSSPLTRGKPEADSERRRSPGLIPAHAGKTPAPEPRRISAPAHPRSRGENLSPDDQALADSGSSPLTRGKR